MSDEQRVDPEDSKMAILSRVPVRTHSGAALKK